MRAILACVQAITATKQVSSRKLAAELLELWHHLMRGSSEQMYALIAELDVSITQMKSLHVLADSGSEVSVKELSDRLGLSLPGASRMVDALLRRGWLERREDPDDRRMKRVGITAEGREVLDRIEAARLAGLEDYAASLTPEQRTRLSSALSDLPHRS
jgi:DNA-binding MarR family transcriptional regulator